MANPALILSLQDLGEIIEKVDHEKQKAKDQGMICEKKTHSKFKSVRRGKLRAASPVSVMLSQELKKRKPKG